MISEVYFWRVLSNAHRPATSLFLQLTPNRIRKAGTLAAMFIEPWRSPDHWVDWVSHGLSLGWSDTPSHRTGASRTETASRPLCVARGFPTDMGKQRETKMMLTFRETGRAESEFLLVLQFLVSSCTDTFLPVGIVKHPILPQGISQQTCEGQSQDGGNEGPRIYYILPEIIFTAKQNGSMSTEFHFGMVKEFWR